MIQRFTLPDSMGALLMIFTLVAVIVYIAASIAEIRKSRQERAVSEFKLSVEKNRTSPALVKSYRAAAAGDPDDYDYWVRTADMFSGGDAE